VNTEIRDKIWHLLYKREPIIHVYRYGGAMTGYFWQDDVGLHWRDENVQPYTTPYTTRIAEPTTEEYELITKGLRSLPLADLESHICSEVIHRGMIGYQIVNRLKSACHNPLSSIDILRTCKQISLERRQVLYGENKFNFDTGRTVTHYRYLGYDHYDGISLQRGVHDHDEFQHIPQLIPGLPKTNGMSQSQQPVDIAIDNIFLSDNAQPHFIDSDPLLRFIRQIGRVNTSFLTNILIQGAMKTVDVATPTRNKRFSAREAAIGFARILPIHTTVLRRTCPKLRSLTLDMEDSLDELAN
jgi:hypothetical protein